MKPQGVRRMMMTVVALLLVLGASRPAGAAPVQNVVGHWMGIFQSKVNMQDFGAFQVLIPTQNHRRFMCTLKIGGNDIPCDGTISAAGVFEVIARKGVFQVHGMYHGDGRGVALAMASYRFRGDEGSLLMVQQTSDQPDPEVFADWHGDFALMDGQQGMLMLDVERCATGDVNGDVRGCMADGTMMVTETLGDLQFRFGFDVFVSSQSTEPPGPDKPTMHPFAMIGLSSMFGDPGTFVVMGKVGMGNADGTFMFFPRGIAETDVVQMGTFQICNQMDVDEIGG